MKKYSCTLFLFFLFMLSVAQQRPKLGLWTAMNLHFNFSRHIQWHNDGGYRTLGASLSPIQYLYRTGLRYNFNGHTSTATGIAFFFTKTDFDKSHHEFGTEFRFWEELNHQQPLKKNLQLLLRLRADQRFFAATSIKEKFTAYRFRFRPGLIKKLNDKWSIQLTDEYMRQFVNHKFSLDQNRLNLSGIYQFDKSAQLQASYLWIKWPLSHQHILSFTFTKIISVYGS